MNIQYSFIPRPMPYPRNPIDEEIILLKQEINQLKERISKLEQEKKNNYLQKDDSLYMMWTIPRSFFCCTISFYVILVNERMSNNV